MIYETRGISGTGLWLPVAIAFLSPLIVATSAAIILGLLGIFMAWLAIVATLLVAIVATDLARRAARRLAPPVRAVERPAVG
jgi:uncharacterized membrane protein